VICTKRRHLTEISTRSSEINNQAFSHFLSQSPWDYRLLLDWIRSNGWKLIGKNGVLIIDECGTPKSGRKSVGVHRQYCGNLGKVENCQVGVFLAYVKQGARILLDFRLYLPYCWIADQNRCDEAGIPESERVFRTKSELAYEMIVQAVRTGIRFRHVCMDGFYGTKPWLLTRLEQMKILFVADIKADEYVYCSEPKYGIPSRNGNKGRKKSKVVVTNTSSIRVDKIIERITKWRTIRVRTSTKGFLDVKFFAIRVWRIDKEVQKPLPVWLLIRKELDDSDVKYSLCNAIHIRSWGKLVRMQSERYWVERIFQDSIDLAGMVDYQVRNWNAWHHHMSLVLLAMFWITKELDVLSEISKDFTRQDVVQIIRLKLPQKILSPLTVAKIILENHKNRKNSRRSRMKQKTKLRHCSL